MTINPDNIFFHILGNTKALHGSNEHGVSEVASTLHWGPASNHNAYYKTHGEL